MQEIESIERLERLVGHLTGIVEALEARNGGVESVPMSPTTTARVGSILRDRGFKQYQDEPAYMTVKEAIAHFNLSRHFFYSNRALLVKAGRSVRVDVKKLRRYLEHE